MVLVALRAYRDDHEPIGSFVSKVVMVFAGRGRACRTWESRRIRELASSNGPINGRPCSAAVASGMSGLVFEQCLVPRFFSRAPLNRFDVLGLFFAPFFLIDVHPRLILWIDFIPLVIDAFFDVGNLILMCLAVLLCIGKKAFAVLPIPLCNVAFSRFWVFLGHPETITEHYTKINIEYDPKG